jgi:hypothetical protein
MLGGTVEIFVATEIVIIDHPLLIGDRFGFTILCQIVVVVVIQRILASIPGRPCLITVRGTFTIAGHAANGMIYMG